MHTVKFIQKHIWQTNKNPIKFISADKPKEITNKMSKQNSSSSPSSSSSSSSSTSQSGCISSVLISIRSALPFSRSGSSAFSSEPPLEEEWSIISDEEIASLSTSAEAPPPASSQSEMSQSSPPRSPLPAPPTSPTSPPASPPSPTRQEIDRIVAAGQAFMRANPNHPLQEYAGLPITISQRDREGLLKFKEELKARIGKLQLFKRVRGKEAREAIKKHGMELIREYKGACSFLGERPEVGDWFFL